MSLYPTPSLLSSSSLVFSLETHSCLLPLASQFSTSECIPKLCIQHNLSSKQHLKIMTSTEASDMKRTFLTSIFSKKSYFHMKLCLASQLLKHCSDSLENSRQTWMEPQFLDLSITYPLYSSIIWYLQTRL